MRSSCTYCGPNLIRSTESSIPLAVKCLSFSESFPQYDPIEKVDQVRENGL